MDAATRTIRRKERRMSRLSEWFQNRWACIDNGIDIPFLDYVVCVATLPIIVFGFIAAIATVPIWGIPYVVYRVYFA